MKVEEIKLAFQNNIKMSATNVSAYIQLPAGVHTIGDKKYTVSEKIENAGLESEWKTTVIDFIEPVTPVI